MGGMFMQEYANKLIVSIDDTVLDKPYSQHMDLVSYFWSGKHHRSVKGIHLITLYATDQIKIFQLIFEFMTNLKVKPRMITLWLCTRQK